MRSHGALGKAPGWGPHDVSSPPQSPGLVFLGFHPVSRYFLPISTRGVPSPLWAAPTLFKQKEKEGTPASGCGPAGCQDAAGEEARLSGAGHTLLLPFWPSNLYSWGS